MELQKSFYGGIALLAWTPGDRLMHYLLILAPHILL